MKRSPLITMLAILWISLASNLQALTDNYNYQVYGVVPQKEPMLKIDGRLNEKTWSDVPVMGEFHFIKETDSRTEERQTLAKVFYTKKAIYIGIECLETKVSSIKHSIKDDSVDAYWFDDCLEIYLETGRTYKRFHKLAINPNGVLWAAKVHNEDADATWKARSGIRAAAAIGKNKWSVELRIPYTGFTIRPKTGDLWTFNIRRIRWGEKKRLEDSSWSPGATYNNPWRFGHLYFEESPGVVDVRKLLALSKEKKNATIEMMLGEARLFLKDNRSIVDALFKKVEKTISTAELEIAAAPPGIRKKFAKGFENIKNKYKELKKRGAKKLIDSKTMALLIAPLKKLRYETQSMIWDIKWRNTKRREKL